MTPAEFIKKIRLSLCVSQSEFADMIKRDKGSVCMYESGKRKPSYATVRCIVDVAKQHGIEATFYDIRND